MEAAGSGVDNLKKGMRVTARPQLVCGRCAPCRRGQYNICEARNTGTAAPFLKTNRYLKSSAVSPLFTLISVTLLSMLDPPASDVTEKGNFTPSTSR